MRRTNTATPEERPEDWLTAMIKSPPEGSIVAKIGPALAGAMLQRNSMNRPPSRRRVAHYATIMAEGGWIYTGEPIVFSRKGVLLNGQQRLMAIVASGVTLPMDVRFGVPEAAFQVMDTSKARTAGDILAILEVPFPGFTASSAAFLYRWDSGLVQSEKGKYGYRSRVDNTTIVEVVRDNPLLVSSVERVLEMKKKVSIYSPTVMAVAHYIFSKRSKKAADDFYDQLLYGPDERSERNPVNRLRQAMHTVERGGHGWITIPRQVQLAHVIKAWNAWRRGEHIDRLMYKSNEAFPLPDQPEGYLEPKVEEKETPAPKRGSRKNPVATTIAKGNGNGVAA